MATSEEIYSQLNNDKITEVVGNIKVTLLGIECLVTSKSVVGDIIESWLQVYLDSKGINYTKPSNSQDFPDFYLNNGNREYLLEVKSFDGTKSPNFDIANFEAYCESLLENPKRLDADYLIFAYELDADNGNLYIKDIWLKKVWEIATSSQDYALKVQQKKGTIYNIRPCTWYSDRAKYKPFSNRKEFVDALANVVNTYTNTNHLKRKGWRKEIEELYEKATGNPL